MIRDINKREVLEMDEYISREEALSVIANMQVEHHYDSANLEDRYVVAHLLEVGVKIKDLKTADVQPVKHGKWICNEELYYNGMTKCSCCNEEYYIEDIQNLQGDLRIVNYCPNCGARMDGDKNG